MIPEYKQGLFFHPENICYLGHYGTEKWWQIFPKIDAAKWVTHWGRVTHICVSKLNIIGSDNGLSPGRRQAIIWTNVGILLIGPLGTNFSEMLIEIHTFSFKKIHLKMSGKWRPFCHGLNVLRVPVYWPRSFQVTHTWLDILFLIYLKVGGNGWPKQNFILIFMYFIWLHLVEHGGTGIMSIYFWKSVTNWAIYCNIRSEVWPGILAFSQLWKILFLTPPHQSNRSFTQAYYLIISYQIVRTERIRVIGGNNC